MIIKKTVLGISIIETVIASALFLIFILGANASLKTLGDNLLDIKKIKQSETLAETSLFVMEDLLLSLNQSDFTDLDSYLNGNPKTGKFYLFWDNNEYLIKNNNELLTDTDLINSENNAKYDGPINIFSETSTEKISTNFYRSFTLTEKKDWGVLGVLDQGLYELKVNICFDDCEIETTKTLIFAR
jgi:hypothetical protein